MGKDAMKSDEATGRATPSDQTDTEQGKAGEVRTAQPFSEDAADERYSQMGGAPKPRPDQVDDPALQDESDKTTQRQE